MRNSKLGITRQIMDFITNPISPSILTIWQINIVITQTTAVINK